VPVLAFCITYPGRSLATPDPQFDVSRLLQLGESCLIDAALSLGMYLEAHENIERLVRDNPRARWVQRIARLRQLEAQVQVQRGIDPHDMGARSEVGIEVDRLLLNEYAARGEMVEKYLQRRPFVHANGFLFSLDRLRKVFKQIASTGAAAAAGNAAEAALLAALPNLADVRNSGAHADDRMRFRDRRGRPLKPQGAQRDGLQVPPGALVFESLRNHNFGSTMNDGSFGEVPVTVEALQACVQCFQDLVNALQWTGESHVFPTPR
jgi:hypothetical protein